MRQDCPECQRLLHDYGLALESHRSLQAKLQFAVNAGNRKSINTLAFEVEEVDTVRTFLQRAIRQHEAVAHPKVASQP